MRVIAGKARSLPLKSVDSLGTRPTQDRTKETLFNVIGTDVYDSVFLDLFSGSGAIGIEALSRGAKRAFFVENNRNALKFIDSNLEFTKLKDDATVLKMDVLEALKYLENQKIVFDIIFMDPPYNKELEKEVLIFLSKSALIDSCSKIIVEASNETKMDYLDELGFVIVKTKQYKTNKHVFIELGGAAND
ncbi:MAG: 16S rRNA (guanine(966)-N(2))-methyltransferase RsmD [Lachnospiraceae bacterium]|nr:16S rRNA (guanine(966)-N(2))-methyltransferase RsmD [Lachnospiraceae bacterium]